MNHRTKKIIGFLLNFIFVIWVAGCLLIWITINGAPGLVLTRQVVVKTEAKVSQLKQAIWPYIYRPYIYSSN